MGNASTAETLVLRWAEAMNDATLADLPYKIELDASGKIEMSPANNRQARLQGYLAGEFARQLSGGAVFSESPVLTSIGVRVPDVAWASDGFIQLHGDTTPFPAAPDLCVEIVSPSNSPEELRAKIRAYLEAGAVEVWIVFEDGRREIHDDAGLASTSRFPLTFTPPPPAQGHASRS